MDQIKSNLKELHEIVDKINNEMKNKSHVLNKGLEAQKANQKSFKQFQ